MTGSVDVTVALTLVETWHCCVRYAESNLVSSIMDDDPAGLLIPLLMPSLRALLPSDSMPDPHPKSNRS